MNPINLIIFRCVRWFVGMWTKIRSTVLQLDIYRCFTNYIFFVFTEDIGCYFHLGLTYKDCCFLHRTDSWFHGLIEIKWRFRILFSTRNRQTYFWYFCSILVSLLRRQRRVTSVLLFGVQCIASAENTRLNSLIKPAPLTRANIPLCSATEPINFIHFRHGYMRIFLIEIELKYWTIRKIYLFESQELLKIALGPMFYFDIFYAGSRIFSFENNCISIFPWYETFLIIFFLNLTNN